MNTFKIKSIKIGPFWQAWAESSPDPAAYANMTTYKPVALAAYYGFTQAHAEKRVEREMGQMNQPRAHLLWQRRDTSSGRFMKIKSAGGSLKAVRRED